MLVRDSLSADVGGGLGIMTSYCSENLNSLIIETVSFFFFFFFGGGIKKQMIVGWLYPHKFIIIQFMYTQTCEFAIYMQFMCKSEFCIQSPL